MMTFPTISAGTRANEPIGGYANFVAYCNALAAGVDSVTTTAAGAALKANNLSDLASASTARTNLGLGTMATATATDYLTKAGNLAGLADLPTARTNLGLGTAAVANTGTGASNVILGNDARLTDTRTPSAASIVDAMIATTLSPSKITGTAAILGANTFTAQQFIDGSSDQIQLRVQGVAGQSVNTVTVENSSGAALASISAAGLGTFAGVASTTGTFSSDVSVGAGSAAVDSLLTINGGTNTGKGGAIAFERGGSSKGYLGTRSFVIGGSTDDISLVSYADLTLGIGSMILMAMSSSANTLNAYSSIAIPVVAKGLSAQTANLQEWQNSSGTALASVSSAGAATFNGVTVAAGYDINASHAAGVTNTRYGSQAMRVAASGTHNTCFGYYSMGALTSGSFNLAVGPTSLAALTTGSRNIGFGYGAFYSLQTGSDNTAVGVSALFATTGSQNTAVGSAAGYYATSGSANIYLGYYAGLYATTQSNELFINSIDRTNRAGDIAGSIIYGVQNATAASQTLTLNAAVTAVYGLSVGDGYNFIIGTTTGSKIGQASSKIGFFNATPVAKPTGVAVDAASIHAALVSLGLISA